eukprot:gene1377-biopygen1224
MLASGAEQKHYTQPTEGELTELHTSDHKMICTTRLDLKAWGTHCPTAQLQRRAKADRLRLPLTEKEGATLRQVLDTAYTRELQDKLQEAINSIKMSATIRHKRKAIDYAGEVVAILGAARDEAVLNTNLPKQAAPPAEQHGLHLPKTLRKARDGHLRERNRCRENINSWKKDIEARECAAEEVRTTDFDNRTEEMREWEQWEREQKKVAAKEARKCIKEHEANRKQKTRLKMRERYWDNIKNYHRKIYRQEIENGSAPAATIQAMETRHGELVVGQQKVAQAMREHMARSAPYKMREPEQGLMGAPPWLDEKYKNYIQRNKCVRPDQRKINLHVDKEAYRQAGDVTQQKNYKPIALLDCLFKLYTAVLTKMLADFCEINGMLSQAQEGSREKHNTMRQLTRITNAIEDANLSKQELHATYIDFENAYGSVDHKKLIATLKHLGVPAQLTEAIKDILGEEEEDSIQMRAKVGEQVSEEIPIRRGILQGDNMSPLLFILYLEALLRWLEVGNHGYQHMYVADKELRDELRTSSGAFVDDLIILTRLMTGMEQQLKKLVAFGDWSGLRINKDKKGGGRHDGGWNPPENAGRRPIQRDTGKWAKQEDPMEAPGREGTHAPTRILASRHYLDNYADPDSKVIQYETQWTDNEGSVLSTWSTEETIRTHLLAHNPSENQGWEDLVDEWERTKQGKRAKREPEDEILAGKPSSEQSYWKRVTHLEISTGETNPDQDIKHILGTKDRQLRTEGDTTYCYEPNGVFASPLNVHKNTKTYYSRYPKDSVFGAVGSAWEAKWEQLGAYQFNPEYTAEDLYRALKKAINATKTAEPVLGVWIYPTYAKSPYRKLLNKHMGYRWEQGEMEETDPQPESQWDNNGKEYQEPDRRFNRNDMVYTDGSERNVKKENGEQEEVTVAGVWDPRGGQDTEHMQRWQGHCQMVNRAELTAIYMALMLDANMGKEEVALYKVKAHVGIHGNEKADEVAKKACVEGEYGLNHDNTDTVKLLAICESTGKQLEGHQAIFNHVTRKVRGAKMTGETNIIKRLKRKLETGPEEWETKKQRIERTEAEQARRNGEPDEPEVDEETGGDTWPEKLEEQQMQEEETEFQQMEQEDEEALIQAQRMRTIQQEENRSVTHPIKEHIEEDEDEPIQEDEWEVEEGEMRRIQEEEMALAQEEQQELELEQARWDMRTPLQGVEEPQDAQQDTALQVTQEMELPKTQDMSMEAQQQAEDELIEMAQQQRKHRRNREHSKKWHSSKQQHKGRQNLRESGGGPRWRRYG